MQGTELLGAPAEYGRRNVPTEAGPGGAATDQAGDSAGKAGGQGRGGEGGCVPLSPGLPRLRLWSRLFLGSDRRFDQSEPRAGLRAANTAAGEELGRGLAGQGRGLGAAEGARAATREPWRWGCSAQGTGDSGAGMMKMGGLSF